MPLLSSPPSHTQIESALRGVTLASPPGSIGKQLSTLPVTPSPRRLGNRFAQPHFSPNTSSPAFSSPGLYDTPYSKASSSPGTPLTPYTPAHSNVFNVGMSKGESYEAYNDHSSFSPTVGLGITLGHAQAESDTKEELAREMAKRKQTSDGRYLTIHGLPHHTSPAEIKELFTGVAELKAIIIKFLASHGFIFLVFFDPCEAQKVQNMLREHPIEFSASPEGGSMLLVTEIPRSGVEQIVGFEETMAQVWEDAEPEVVLRVVAYNTSAMVAQASLQSALASIGRVRSFRVLGTDSQTYIAEFFDTRHAAVAVVSLNGSITSGCRILVTRAADFQDELDCQLQVRSASRDPFGYKTPPRAPRAFYAEQQTSPVRRSLKINELDPRDVKTYVPPARRETLASTTTGQFGSLPPLLPSPSSILQQQLQKHRERLGLHRQVDLDAGFDNFKPRKLSVEDEGQTKDEKPSQDFTAFLGEVSRRTFKESLPERQRIPEPNIVDMDKVRSGLDPRTTVMVKDVPNKLSREQLIDILQEVVPDDFDFVYLRFDFKNRCNVGYAFVNFCSTSALYKFMDAKVGRKWNMFQSEKVLQVSYADIQGKTALINKFRNSSVMDVNEEWRPQAFHSGGPLKGKPMEFPESDDPRQRYRSTAARMISLFNEPLVPSDKSSSRRSPRSKW